MFASSAEWMDDLAENATLQRVVALQLPLFAGEHFSQDVKSALEEGLAAAAAHQTNGGLDWSQVKAAVGADKYKALLSKAFQEQDFMDSVENAYKAELGPQSNKRTRHAGSGSGSGPDGNTSRANGSNPACGAASSPANPASASPGAANSPSARAGDAGHTSASAAAQAAPTDPAFDPWDERFFPAVPTERPRPSASRPLIKWGDDTEQPHTWTPMDDPRTFECVPLASDSNEYRIWHIQMEIFGLKVTAVTRIQNPRLWERYVLERSHMLRRKGQGARTDLPDFDLRESLLYHCSREPDHTRICREGLDLRLAKEGTFGAGIYLTDDPRKAVDYRGSTSKLYICAALLGDVLAVPAWDGLASWKTEPEKAAEDQRSPADRHFDSLVGRRAYSSGTTGANEFVLYERSATCPMYMVELASASRDQGRDAPSAMRGVPDFAWKSKRVLDSEVDVPNPFGNVAGSSNYTDDGHPWNLFLHSFYHVVLGYPDFSRPLRTRPLGSPTTTCTERVVTEAALAEFRGLKCVICHDPLVKGDICLVMPCGDVNGHAKCCHPLIKTRSMADRVTSQTFTRCHVCMQRFGVTMGKQPLNARMTHQVVPWLTLAGHGKGAIKIVYHIPNGRQDADGDEPEKPFQGTDREAYLPDSTEGRDVLKWLQQAFKQRLIFSIGTSLTTGENNVVVWAGIHHKTDLTPHSEYGYPDGTYLTRVKAEMQQAGVVL
eukprot:jgi/Mesvir1/25111/Mv21575-RA.1